MDNLPELKKVYKPIAINHPTSRYRMTDICQFEDGVEIMSNLENIKIRKSDLDEYYTLKATEAGRLDMVSTAYYGVPDYWWAIAYASNILDPLTVQEGTLVRIPPIATVLNIKGVFR